MKRTTIQWSICMAAALLGFTTSASGQQQEYIVGGQVVSDEVTVPGSYVGDMSTTEAGCQNCGDGNGSCPGGVCNGNGSGNGDGSGNGIGGNGRGLFGGLFGNRNDEEGVCVPRGYGRPDLFYNYYTQGNCNQAKAQMYLSPLPVPPNVGHTFYTYQPFYPHEMLYWHKDRFHNYYDSGRGMNRTKAVYYSPPVRQALSNFYWNKIRLPR
jgi:hypothetical protein